MSSFCLVAFKHTVYRKQITEKQKNNSSKVFLKVAIMNVAMTHL